MISFKLKEKKEEVIDKPSAITTLFQDAVEEEEEINKELISGGPRSWFKIEEPTDSEEAFVEADGEEEAEVKILKDSESCSSADEKSDRKRKPSGLVSLGRFSKEQKVEKTNEAESSYSSRYIAKLMSQSTNREMEQEVIKERLLKKEKDVQDDEEVFVTGAYKRRLEARRKYEEETIKKDLKDALNDPRKKKDLSSFHHHLLASGLASRSRVRDLPENN